VVPASSVLRCLRRGDCEKEALCGIIQPALALSGKGHVRRKHSFGGDFQYFRPPVGGTDGEIHNARALKGENR